MSEIYRDDTLVITQKTDGLYIESFMEGKSPEAFAGILRQFPFISITNFQTVIKALNNAPYGPELFAVAKDRIKVEISNDQLEAYLILHVSQEELDKKHRKDLILDVMDALNSANITYGIVYDALKGDLNTGSPILIAQGLRPVPGQDSRIRLYEIKEPKPAIIDNGKANFYDMNLIQQVRVGDWLGERIDPVPGISGINVHGKEIPPVNGITLPLHYDRNSVELVRENNKDVLYSLKSGAVHFINDSIAVYDVMEIKGSVDFNTGNIDFHGYVSIKGSVEENFSVLAKKDIEISGEYGLGGVGVIKSQEGNIYIRGGVAGKNRAKIICKKNLYVKYLSDVEVICEGTVYIGFYARNSTIRARQVIVDSPRGQIVGGLTDADVSVECAIIGSWAETRTLIVVRGFDRDDLQHRVNEIASFVQVKREQLGKLKKMMQSKDRDRSTSDNSHIQKSRQALRQLQEEIRGLEAERLSTQSYIKTPGEGAVIVKKQIFPKVRLAIQGETMEITNETMATVFIVRDGMIQSV